MKRAQTAIVVLLVLILVAMLVIIFIQLAGPITGRIISGVGERIYGSGTVVSRQYDLSDFKDVEIKGKGDLFIEQDDDFGVKVVAEDNILDPLNPRVEGDKLIIGDKKLFFYNTKPIKIYVSMPDVDTIRVSGSGDIKSQEQIKTKELNIIVAGASDINMNLDVEKLGTKISGSADAYYKGKVIEHDIGISGSGDIEAFDLTSERTDITISGLGDVEVDASSGLNIQISGSGTVTYQGSPQITQSISGVGKIRNQ